MQLNNYLLKISKWAYQWKMPFKSNKGTKVIKTLSNTLPRDALLTIYKSFVRPHLD